MSSANFLKGWDAWNKRDYGTALREWEPLAKKGDADAQSWLGYMYSEGKGVTRDYKSAFKWFMLASEQDDTSAQRNLGLLYEDGWGVTQDYISAYMWFSVAISLGYEPVRKDLDRVENEMTSTQIETAQRLARKYMENNYKKK